mmetsp:Transcript_5257/g.10997  ORF Transcript_5257/g.10997 Transcript_5257/m.10997 type:complete len:208 (-) Transcript_5257:373-996(-)
MISLALRPRAWRKAVRHATSSLWTSPNSGWAFMVASLFSNSTLIISLCSLFLLTQPTYFPNTFKKLSRDPRAHSLSFSNANRTPSRVNPTRAGDNFGSSLPTPRDWENRDANSSRAWNCSWCFCSASSKAAISSSVGESLSISSGSFSIQAWNIPVNVVICASNNRTGSALFISRESAETMVLHSCPLPVRCDNTIPASLLFPWVQL